MTEAHAAQAERYWLQGGLAAALEQLSLARKAGSSSGGGTDFMSLSQIDAKITQVRQEMLRLKEEARQP
jgi:predicted Zn-dependent protease